MAYPISTGSTLISSSDFTEIKDRVDSIIGNTATGYGRSWSRVLPATTGSLVELWNELLVDVYEIALHQTGSTSTWAGEPLYNLGLPGQVVSADFHNYINTLTTVLSTNRYQIAQSQYKSLVVQQGSYSGESRRSSEWTGQEIAHQVKVSWYNGQQAQYWFNLGGRVEIKPRYELPVGSDPDDLGWAAFIDSISTQTYVRSDFVGNQTKFYPVLQNGSGYTFALKATRDDQNANILFDLSYNFSGSGGVVVGPSLVVVPNSFIFDITDAAGTPFSLSSVIPGSSTTYADQSNDSNRMIINFEPNGSFNLQGTTQGVMFAGNWGSPTTVGVGQNYWIRFVLNSLAGSNDYQATQTSGWLNLASTRSINLLTTVLAGKGNSIALANYTVEIASSSSGTPQVASGNFTLSSQARQSVVGLSSTLPQNNTTFTHSDYGDVRLILSFLPNGTVEILGRAILATTTTDILKTSFNWFTPTTSGVGTNYFIKIVKISESDSGPGSGAASDIISYQQLGQTRSVVLNSISTNEGNRVDTVIYQISISSSNSDSNIVTSGLYTLETTSQAIVSYDTGGGGGVRDNNIKYDLK